MSGQVQAYRVLNAKLRARIGALLAEDFFRTLAGSATVEEAVTALDEQGFTDVAETYRTTGDVRLCEQELYRREIGSLLEAERHLDGERRAFVAAVADRYEIENLKTAVRLWFESAVRGRRIESKIAYLSRVPVHRHIDYDRIVNAASWADIPAALENTPYAAPVSETIDHVQQSGSLFSLERRLDRDYFERMLAAARALPRRDREAAEALIALEADRENASWVVRAVSYYGLSEEDVTAGLVPGGAAFDSRTLRRAARAERPGTELVDALGTQAAGGGATAAGRHARELEFVEAALGEEAERLVRRWLGGYPFMMGVVLAYYLVTMRELRRVSAVLNSLFYGLEADVVEAAL
ncbi:MAG: V0D/AC39 family V-type ATPase subunit [Spirochaetaceae bacterium]